MRENHSVEVEPEPVSVQVVERVGLIAFFPLGNIFGFGYAVFAEEVGDIDDQHDLAFVRLKRGVSRERALLG